MMIINENVKNNHLTKIIYLSLILSFLFYIYRYPLQYGSSGTSPTYSDTPLPFQVAKYILIIFLTFLSSIAFFLQKRSTQIPFKTIILFGFLFLGINIIKLSGLPEGEVSESIKSTFFLPIIIIASLSCLTIKVDDVIKIIFIFVIIHFLADITQLGSYIAFGRLPSLAKKGSIFIRFGGLWDDPNALACYLIMPLAILLSRSAFDRQLNKNFKTWIYYLIIFFMFFLTLSITGLIMAIILFTLDAILKKQILKIMVFALITGLIIYLLFTLGITKDILIDYMLSKEGSVSGHTNTEIFYRFSYLHLLFGDFKKYFLHESYYISFFLNFGILPLILLLIGLVLFTLKAFKLSNFFCIKGYQDEAIFFRAVALFIICFSIGNINLPYLAIFPINFFFWFLLLICENETIISKRITFFGNHGLINPGI